MPPPPVPNRSSISSSSPYMHPNQHRHPATPASLMKLPADATTRPPHSTGQQSTELMMESLELPESLTNGPSPSSWDAEPKPAPWMAAPLSLPSPAVRSPQLRPGSSGPGGKRTAPSGSRAGRDRSAGSVQASPALLPKISPNIKPLLPGAAGDETASRLLMSKSNYQNLVEGNTVPGVSYPSELSTNLTSKRTSHKMAEQGRRNRINSALNVMAGLLSADSDGRDDEVEAEGGKQQQSSSSSNGVANSKASVVERAIVHMKKLQEENAQLRKQVRELKAGLEGRGTWSDGDGS
ncbi:hypothetical protein CDD80_7577 [Ophiocordyceps camponoti-rufipedis]|uniref:BHLH domain-containing protein n=1 Tax=Ophiocordyceps camponoti-rufipedis TaxID=2004952 RepID=A0A2C5YHY5_9HYPO|nr:hypothetical protein CDD80_7577 [Ophiocordyceps camponoti-rufipedis]